MLMTGTVLTADDIFGYTLILNSALNDSKIQSTVRNSRLPNNSQPRVS
jgi:hypothetical protein